MKRILTLLAVGTMLAGPAAADTPIYTAPEGTKLTYERFCNYIKGTTGYFYTTTASGYTSEMIITEDNEVYYKNPVVSENFSFGSYLKGKKEGNTITFELPQLMGTRDNVDYYCYLLEYEPNTSYQYNVGYDNPVKFVIDEDGVVTMDGVTYYDDNKKYPEFVLGYIGDGLKFEGVGEYATQLNPYSMADVVYPPSTATPLDGEWVIKTDALGVFTIDVLRDGDDIYLGQLSETLPGYAKGTVTDGKVNFASGQLMGVLGNSVQYFMGASLDKQGKIKKLTESVSMDLSDDGLQLTCEDAFVINGGSVNISPIKSFIQPTINFIIDDGKVYPPADPVLIKTIDMGGVYSYLQFELPNYDTLGRPMDTSKMYYNLYMDGEIYDFLVADSSEGGYPCLDGFGTETVRDIPYDYKDTKDSKYFYVRGVIHEVLYREKGLESLGIRSFYVDDENERHYSNLVTMELQGEDPEDPENPDDPTDPDNPDAGVSELTGEAGVSVWYDLQGRQVTNPQQGVFVRVEKLANGESKRSKVVLK